MEVVGRHTVCRPKVGLEPLAANPRSVCGLVGAFVDACSGASKDDPTNRTRDCGADQRSGDGRSQTGSIANDLSAYDLAISRLHAAKLRHFFLLFPNRWQCRQLLDCAPASRQKPAGKCVIKFAVVSAQFVAVRDGGGTSRHIR